jgi:hypothetical protein
MQRHDSRESGVWQCEDIPASRIEIEIIKKISRHMCGYRIVGGDLRPNFQTTVAR